MSQGTVFCGLVYVVMSDDSSHERCVHSIFSTKEQAEECAASIDDSEVFEIHVDVDGGHPPGLKPFRIDIGNNGPVAVRECLPFRAIGFRAGPFVIGSTFPEPQAPEDVVYFRVWCFDQHAAEEEARNIYSEQLNNRH